MHSRKISRRCGLVALVAVAGLLSMVPALASPQQCASFWVERNRPFAEAGLCVETNLWKSVFPGISCQYTSGSEVSLSEDVAARLTEIRAMEMQLGCMIDTSFDNPETAASSLWLDIGDKGSIFSERDGYANLRDAPSAKSGNLVGRLEDGSQVTVLEKVQSPDNQAQWFRVNYADNIGRLRSAFVHYASVFPKREVMGMIEIALGRQLNFVNAVGVNPLPSALRVRFWTRENPGDIWSVLSLPSYSRGGKELLEFDVAFAATDGWSAEDLDGTSALCKWQAGKQQARCFGEAGEFSITAPRNKVTGALRGLGLHLEGDTGKMVPAGFGRQLVISPLNGSVQLGIAISGLEILKSGVIRPRQAENEAYSPVPEENETTAMPAAAPVPEQVAETLGEFDEIMSLIE